MFRSLIVTIIAVALFGSAKAENDEIIENIHAEGGVTSAKITWNIVYDSLPLRKKLVIRYVKTNRSNLSLNPEWNYSKAIDGNRTSMEIKGLTVNEGYTFAIGVLNSKGSKGEHLKNADIIWSNEKSFITNRGWSLGQGLIIRILILLGSLALFIYGMKVMSEGVQKAAGQKLREILGTITKNKIKGIFSGFFTTAIIQSSSATTVMVVSFVNAGLISLRQSLGIIMGANIGTTVTAWIVAFMGFSVSTPDYAMPGFLIALILIFSNRSTTRSWGEVLAGFAILFLGLELLRNGVPDVNESVDSLAFLQTLSGNGIFSVLLFILIGTLITVVVQSSSAAMAVTILLCERGIIPFEMAAGMVLGENIGTTLTANLAAIVGNVHAKRAARAHFVINVFGVTWMVLVFSYYLDLIDYLVSIKMPSPYEHQASRPVALALYHTGFNLLNVCILVWFTEAIVKVVTWLVPARSSTDEEFHLDYISAGVMATPELFLLEAQKELAKFGKITSKMSVFVRNLMYEQDKKAKKKLYERIAKYEEITDRVQIEISNYLSECTENELSHDSAIRVRGMMSITIELERIGDIFYQMSLTFKRKDEEKIWFTTEQRENIKTMLLAIDVAFDEMIRNLKDTSTDIDIESAIEKENEINKLRDRFRAEHLSIIDSNEFNVRSGIIYTDLIYSCEKVGDHIINVSEAISGKNILGE